VRWHKILLNAPEYRTALLTIVQRIDHIADNPQDFAVFSDTEVNDGIEVFAYYFSPVAAKHCLPYLAQFSPTPCDKPLGDLDSGFELAYGSPKAWDLLVG
jgi:hypothetical protein